MPYSGPVIVLEDDLDEQQLLRDSYEETNYINELKFFRDGNVFLEYLTNTTDKPFIIISCIYLQGISGLEVRRQIQANDFLRKKGIPYLFLTIRDDMEIINMAYDLTVQGFFLKRFSKNEHSRQLKLILDYWVHCKHPNSHKL